MMGEISADCRGGSPYIRNVHFAGALLLAAGLALAACATATPVGNADLVFRNGKIVDGTGAQPYAGDVAVTGDRISFVGAEYGGRAAREIDASGMVIAPGFIDAHSHTDRSLGEPGKGGNEGVVRQGVTTIVGGPDGGASPSKIKSYLSSYEANGIATNVAFYVGHNAIRREVIGNAAREATQSEIERMRALVREGMEMGAVGFSTGLMYEPGMWSTTQEVIDLAKEAAPYDGVYDSHVRKPVFALIESDEEAIEIGRKAGVDVKIGHEKAVGVHNRGAIEKVIALVNAARAEGITVVTDQYPYDGAATKQLQDVILLPAAQRAELANLMKAENDPESAARKKIAYLKKAFRNRNILNAAREISEHGDDGGFSWISAVGYSSIRIVNAPEQPDLVGVHLSELSEARNESGFDVLAALISNSSEPILATMGSVAESDVELLLPQPWNMIASDGSWAAETDEPMGGHPRSTGAFPRVLGHYVRERGVLTLSDAINKMTDFPATFLKLEDRGALKNGNFADIVVFDENEIDARSNWENPTLYATGVRDVMVNGRFVLQNGAMTDERPGRYVQRNTSRSE